MFVRILALVCILGIAYFIDFKRLKESNLGYKLCYGVTFVVGFGLSAWYVLNRGGPSVLSLFRKHM